MKNEYITNIFMDFHEGFYNFIKIYCNVLKFILYIYSCKKTIDILYHYTL